MKLRQLLGLAAWQDGDDVVVQSEGALLLFRLAHGVIYLHIDQRLTTQTHAQTHIRHAPSIFPRAALARVVEVQ